MASGSGGFKREEKFGRLKTKKGASQKEKQLISGSSVGFIHLQSVSNDKRVFPPTYSLLLKISSFFVF